MPSHREQQPAHLTGAGGPRLVATVDGDEREWPLGGRTTCVLGRDAAADIVLPFAAVSRRHAEVTVSHGSYFIADLGSLNGTFVNGEALGRAPRELTDGDEIVLGGVVSLRFWNPGQTILGMRLGRLTGIWIDEGTRDAWADGRPVRPALSAAQFALLRLLYGHPGQVISRDEVIAAVWPEADPSGVSEEALDGLIKRLRTRLRETSPNADYVEVVRGQGVRLVQPAR